MSDFIIEDGVLKRYVGPGGDVVIPNGVVRIAVGAFLRCSCLKRVTIPGSVQEIGPWAFKSCAALEEARLSEGLELIFHAFEDCVSLREIWIPARAVKMSSYPFKGCVGLEAVHVAGDNPAFCDVDGVMYNRDKTALIVYPWAGGHIHAFPRTLKWIDRQSFTCSKETQINLLWVANDQEITPEMLKERVRPLYQTHLAAAYEHHVELQPMNELRARSEPGEYLLLARAAIPLEAEP